MEEKLKIFFCEDDENLGMLLREYLQAKGYVTDLFSDGEAGYKGFTKGKCGNSYYLLDGQDLERRYSGRFQNRCG